MIKKIAVGKKKTSVVAATRKKTQTIVRPKKKKVLAIPKGYHSITPYLIVQDAISAINFYKKAFGAKETICMNTPDGKVAHAELKIGDSKIMLGEECHKMDASSPKTYGGSPVGIHLYVKNVDAVFKQAIAAGAKIIRAIEDQFYGDRSGMLEDPYGHKWNVSTHIEDVSVATMKKRMKELQTD